MNVDKLLVEAGAYFGGDGVNYDRFEPHKFAALVLATTTPPQTEQAPVAWRTFDGEGGYDYRSYEDNESYADDWNKRNPNHSGWVDKLYTHSQPEPFGWLYSEGFDALKAGKCWTAYGTKQDDTNSIPVYLNPPQRTFVGLTDEEIEYVWRKVETSDFHDCVLLFAKELEAKLKQKNGYAENKNS